MRLIRRGNTGKVSNNFTEKEIYDAAFGDVGVSFGFDQTTIDGWQIVRDYYGLKIKPTATYRTRDWDLSKNRSGYGHHVKRKAMDAKFVDESSDINKETLLKLHQEILNEGPLYHKLRVAGIGGIGLYDTFTHLDSRTAGNQTDEYGTWGFWDNRLLTKKNSRR